ncbi:uncharacterized protein N7496_002174 [Penicillium cataractarum]|uniref:Uncharacterized protein n=1 Tax=Penicillium cataractarum TaxID=2100454 RepID=A0A9W9SJH1_9EURO|nr:uncharacterized protein N7496_002174 [Penicillium cataractarum]KAJ5379746.1 hypothetical protein N7496_002174 [Penicillium cataractarum]
MSSESDSAARPSPQTTPESGTPPKKHTIFNFNATNPDFVPGYSVLRVEQAKHMTPEAKTRLMNTIVDDLVASVGLINEYHRNGTLSDENIFQVSTMMQSIRHNNAKVEGRWDEKIERLRRDRRQVQRDYRDLARQMDVMGQKYAGKVKVLEGQVEALKKQIAWMEAGGPLRQSESWLGENVDRRCVSEEVDMVETSNGREQMGEDDADGEWEEESI